MILFYQSYVLLLAIEQLQEQHRRRTHGTPTPHTERLERIRLQAYRRYRRRNPYR